MRLGEKRADKRQPMKFPDHVTVLHKLSHMPKPDDTAFSLEVMILSELHQRPSARCIEDIVMYDYTKGQKERIPSWMMDACARVWEEQEAERKRAEELRNKIAGLVDALELGTWRGGAEEDMGGK